MSVTVEAASFAHDGSTQVGVLLCHGFTSTPQSMRPWSDYLAEQGFTVRCPLLPGHGTTWQELNRTHWTDWYGTAELMLNELRQRCDLVFVCGLSMGGTLTLRLAECYHDQIDGLVLVNPSVTSTRKDVRLLPILSKILPSVAAIAGDIAKPNVVELSYSRTPLRAANSLRKLWKIVQRDLNHIHQPLLLLHSAIDHVVEPINATIVLNNVSSADTQEIVLPRSYHVATLDYDAPTIFDLSTRFIQRVQQQRTQQRIPQQ